MHHEPPSSNSPDTPDTATGATTGVAQDADPRPWWPLEDAEELREELVRA
ncbi:MAG: hypothetical protein ACR2KP_17740 [Egibacteraceae bacterium]